MKKLQSILCAMALTLTIFSAAFGRDGLISGGRNGLISGGRAGLISGGAPDAVDETDIDIMGIMLSEILIP